jgi:ABC-type Fe3+ transport system substrate-binding protein
MKRSADVPIRSTWMQAAAVVAVAAVLAACGGGAITLPPEVDERSPLERALDAITEAGLEGPELDAYLLERALEEGGMVLHYGTMEAEVLDGWSAGFAARFSALEHGAVRLRSAEIAERVRLERGARADSVDVLDTTDAAFQRLVAEGFVAEHRGVLAVDGLPAVHVDAHSAVFSLQPLVITWNTRSMAGTTPPRTWDEVLLRESDGCVISDSPSLIVGLIGDRGIDAARQWLEAFLASGGRVVQGNTAAVAGLASGEYPCAAAGTLSSVEELAALGAPLDWHAPDPTPVLRYRLGIAADTKRPHAAMLFVRWALGPEGAAVVSDSARLSTRPDVVSGSERSRGFVTPGDPLAGRLQVIDGAREVEIANLALELLDELIVPAAGG